MSSVPPNQPRIAGQPETGWPVDQRTPVAERWGGWFVTGRRLPARHLGTTELGRVAPPTYLSASSDVAALLVLTHQVHVINAIARLNRALEGDPDRHSPRAGRLADQLADALTFTDASPLPAAISGEPPFVRAFEHRDPAEPPGRSLRQLDMPSGHLFRYPLSYLLQSPAFEMLPLPARTDVLERVRVRLASPGNNVRIGSTAESEERRHTALQILRTIERDFGTQ